MVCKKSSQFARLAECCRLLWRAYNVIQLPNDELVEKLGLDIPPEPDLTLEEISAHHVQLAWKPIVEYGSSVSPVQEYQIEVNGRLAGSTRRNETAAQISNLCPGTYYTIRIFSVSPGRFQTPSAPLYIRTQHATDESQDSKDSEFPQVRPLSLRTSSTPTSTLVPTMIRQLSENQPAGRRNTGTRKTSPAEHADGSGDDRDAEQEQSEDLAELSQQFQDLSREREIIEAQIEDDTREHDDAIKEKETTLHTLKQEMKERDEASSELRKQVHKAEAHNRAMQNERTKREKQVKEREQKRRRRRDEVTKWEERSQSMVDEIEGMDKQKDAIRKRVQSEVREAREKIAEEQKEIQQLDEENRELGAKIKELLEERKRAAIEEDAEEAHEADRRDQEIETYFKQRLGDLAQQYQFHMADLQKLQQENVLARQKLAMVQTVQRNTMQQYSHMAVTDVDALHRVDRQARRPRHTSSHGSNVSSPRNAFAAEPFSTINQQVTMSTALNIRPMAINPMNGMALPPPVPAPPTEEEEEGSIAPPMSPRGEALLPHDLLGDESNDDMRPDEENLPTMKPTVTDYAPSSFSQMAPPSPRRVNFQSSTSSASRSASSPGSFLSPKEELFPEHDDRSSVYSNQTRPTEDTLENTHRRLPSMAGIFSFNRQRGKTSAHESPALGTLKSHQSHSFPRKLEDEIDLHRKPSRRLSYGNTSWAFSASEKVEDPKQSLARRAFMMATNGISKRATPSYDPFAPRTNSLDPAGRGGSSSPRPGSVYSIDSRMPRMSMEDTLRTDWGFRRGPRNSPLAPDWVSAISRTHSRRQSLYSSATNLSTFGNVEGVMDGEVIPPHRDSRPLQAPIGTRPTSSQAARPATPKLNPAAPSFTMFGLVKNKDRTRERDKEREKDKNKPESPPESRKSKDAPSVTNTFSTSESRDSLERTTSGLSMGASVETTPVTKSTLLSKITRKASSNKFDSWKTKSTLFSSSKVKSNEASTPNGDVTTIEDDYPMAISYEQLGKTAESTTPTPGGEDKKSASRTSLGSWNFMKRKKKEELAASEISESSELISESGHETDDHEREVAWTESAKA